MPLNPRTVYFHEDDYCQVELQPGQNWQHCADELKRIDEHFMAHSVPGGWTRMYVRGKSPLPFSSLQINRIDFSAAMPVSWPSFDRVVTGTLVWSEECPQTMAFGPRQWLAIFASYNPEGTVTACWFELEITNPDETTIVRELLESLSRWKVLFVDWNWSRLLRIDDVVGFESYFNRYDE